MGTVSYWGDMTALTYEGGTDVMAMLTFIEQVLARTLDREHIVVLDRLGSHMDPEVSKAVRATGARLWHVPPYSHDPFTYRIASTLRQQFSAGPNPIQRAPAENCLKPLDIRQLNKKKRVYTRTQRFVSASRRVRAYVDSLPPHSIQSSKTSQ